MVGELTAAMRRCAPMRCLVVWSTTWCALLITPASGWVGGTFCASPAQRRMVSVLRHTMTSAPPSTPTPSAVTGTTFGLEGTSNDDWKRFVGEECEHMPLRARTYEDGLAENRADHIRDCNARPWGSFKRFVRRKDRDVNYVPTWAHPSEAIQADGSILLVVRPEHAGAKSSIAHRIAISNGPLVSQAECAAIVAEAESVSLWSKDFPHASLERGKRNRGGESGSNVCACVEFPQHSLERSRRRRRVVIVLCDGVGYSMYGLAKSRTLTHAYIHPHRVMHARQNCGRFAA